VPIYEYQCPDCGYQFEQLQKISDEPIRVCPNCEQTHVRKLVSQTSFVLKGGGWYKDHYGLKGGKSEGSSSSTETSSSTGGDKPAAATPAPAATESKPAAATSTAPASTPSKKTPSSAA